MIKYNNYLDKHGFPKIPTPNNEIKIKYINKVFLFAKFIRRFDICLKLQYSKKFSKIIYLIYRYTLLHS